MGRHITNITSEKVRMNEPFCENIRTFCFAVSAQRIPLDRLSHFNTDMQLVLEAYTDA